MLGENDFNRMYEQWDIKKNSQHGQRTTCNQISKREKWLVLDNGTRRGR